MVRPDWVGHSGVTSAHFSPVACSALWLIAYRTNGLVLRLTDTINLGVTLIHNAVFKLTYGTTKAIFGDNC